MHIAFQVNYDQSVNETWFSDDDTKKKIKVEIKPLSNGDGTGSGGGAGSSVDELQRAVGGLELVPPPLVSVAYELFHSILSWFPDFSPSLLFESNAVEIATPIGT